LKILLLSWAACPYYIYNTYNCFKTKKKLFTWAATKWR